MLEVLDLRLL
uniref:Uncharacterized protein n=1 Tax=Anguilla anguilla TaxID=7936 RepID=A0A0E9Q2H0_ANGAN